MATRKTNNTAKAASKRESDFDADKFLADWNANERQPLPKGAIKGMPDKQPPPDMHYDVNHWAWIPNNPPKSDDKNEDSDTTMDNTVETVKTVKAVDTIETVESTTMAKTNTTIAPTITSAMDKVTDVNEAATDVKLAADTPKASRISGRMRRANRDEFCGTYTRKVDTKGGSPINIAPDILKMAHVICAKSGNYKSCPTYVINNILRAVFENMADEIKSWPLPE